MKTKLSLLLLLIAVAVISCKKNQVAESVDDYSSTPVLPSSPDNYANSSNDRLATLGRVLFYDKNLSLNNSVSCGSCHQQARAFTDNLRFSVGLEDKHTDRNTPSIFAKAGRVFWDGRASSMQDLVLRPIKNHVEMKFENMDQLAQKISKIDYYPELFQNAFGHPFIDSTRIKLALAEFLRNFNFASNKFTRVSKRQDNFTASETIGKNVFFSKGKCSSCHHIESQPNLIPTFGDSTRNGYGFTDQSFNIGLDRSYSDNGIGAVSGQPTDNGKFMVPVLLNVEYTAPYMHDGRFKTLEEVVEHYNSGIQAHPNLNVELRDLSSVGNDPFLLDVNHNGFLEPAELAVAPPVRLNLTDVEKRGLVDFLKTLSDPSILTDSKFKNPFSRK